MKKAALFFMALVILVGYAVRDSGAAEMCWNLNPFTDIIKVSMVKPDPLLPHKLITGFWKATGDYVIPVVGSFETDLGGVNKRLSLHGTNNTTSFSGYRDCILDATLSPTSTPKWEGPWEINCGAGGFTNSGVELTRIDCTTLAPLSFSATQSSNNKAAGE
jgi:hypothetical protein